MNFNLLFEPKKIAIILPDNKISLSIIKYLFATYIFVLLTHLLLGPSVLIEPIKLFISQTEKYNIGLVIGGVLFTIIIYILVELLFLAIIVAITKIILKTSKNSLSLFKLVNIYIYKEIVNIFIVQIIGMAVIFSLRMAIYDGSTLPELMISSTKNELIYFIANLIRFTGLIVSFGVYIFTLKTAVQRSTKVSGV